LFACTRLGKPELCNKVGVPGMPPFPARGVTEYRIVDVRSVMAESIDPGLRTESWYRNGTQVVRIGIRYCEPSCNTDGFVFELYIMEPHADGFRLAAWTSAITRFAKTRSRMSRNAAFSWAISGDAT
jgi:hypothetical protein